LTFPQVTDGRGLRAVTTNLEHVILRTGERQARDIVDAGPFDVLVSDQLDIGSALAAELTGTPVASIALVPLSLPAATCRRRGWPCCRREDRSAWSATRFSARSRPLR
jgi:hypothetical protein